jgi:hypothetical protein
MQNITLVLGSITHITYGIVAWRNKRQRSQVAFIKAQPLFSIPIARWREFLYCRLFQKTLCANWDSKSAARVVKKGGVLSVFPIMPNLLIYTYTHAHRHTHMHTHMHAYTHACIHTHTHTGAGAQTHTHRRGRARAHTHTHTHTGAGACTQPHIHSR